MEKPKKWKEDYVGIFFAEEIRTARIHNQCCDAWEKREDELKEQIQKHYDIYGYEKQNYLKEILEDFFNTKFEID